MTTPSTIDVSRRGRSRRIGCLIVATVLLAIIVAGVFVVRWRLTKPAYGDVGQELEYRLTGLVGDGKLIRNVVLYVAKGDGSWTWSGAAGIAHEDTQQPMTADTPIYIASVKKLYVAAAVMRLVERGELALDDHRSGAE